MISLWALSIDLKWTNFEKKNFSIYALLGLEVFQINENQIKEWLHVNLR